VPRPDDSPAKRGTLGLLKREGNARLVWSHLAFRLRCSISSGSLSAVLTVRASAPFAL